LGGGSYKFDGIGGSGVSGDVILLPDTDVSLPIGLNNTYTISF